MAGEHDDMMFSWGHFYLTLNEKAIEPRGEAKSNAEIFRLLSKAFGFDDDPRFTLSDMELAAHYIQWDAPQMGGIDMDYFRKHGYFHLAVGTPDDRLPHANGNFPTPSGKVEFMVEDAKNFVAPPFRMMYEENQSGEDVDPLPGYMPPRESMETNPNLAEHYPLNIISPKSHGFLKSCYANEPHKNKGQVEQFVLISPKDAEARSIREGDPVRVFNGRGDFEGLARVTDDGGEGVIVATLG
jgi:anaerobic selenocysteine-containing dehydrogenase